MTRRIALIEPCLGGNEAAYLNECVETNYVSSVGPFVQRFEQLFAERTSRRYAVACASGTAALHVAMKVMGVKRGGRDPSTNTDVYCVGERRDLYGRIRAVRRQ